MSEQARQPIQIPAAPDVRGRELMPEQMRMDMYVNTRTFGKRRDFPSRVSSDQRQA